MKRVLAPYRNALARLHARSIRELPGQFWAYLHSRPEPEDPARLRRTLTRLVFVRLLILLVLGFLDKNAPIPFFDPHHMRLGSVLGRIGLAGFVSVVLYLNLSSMKRLGVAGGILLAYYAALFLIPVPGFGANHLPPCSAAVW